MVEPPIGKKIDVRQIGSFPQGIGVENKQSLKQSSETFLPINTSLETPVLSRFLRSQKAQVLHETFCSIIEMELHVVSSINGASK